MTGILGDGELGYFELADDGIETSLAAISWSSTSDLTIGSSLVHVKHGAVDWSSTSDFSPDGRLVVNAVRASFNWSSTSRFYVHSHVPYVGRSAEMVLHVMESDGGTFTLTYGAYTTGALDWDLTAEELQAALEALTSIGAGNITVEGGPGAEGPFLITFAGDLAETPVGLITSTDSLTGPDGLNPHVGLRSLSPGYSTDDDHGTKDQIVVHVGAAGGLGWNSWEFTGRRAYVTISDNEKGGHETASWTVYATAPYVNFVPFLNSKVVVYDKRGPFWEGILASSQYKVTAGLMVIDMEARGRYSTTQDIPYDHRRVFAEGTSVGTIFSKVRQELCSGTADAVSNTDDFLGSGVNLPNESPDFFNRTASSIFDEYGTLGNYPDTRLVWGMRLPFDDDYIPDVPVLYLRPEPLLIDTKYRVYLADGASIDYAMDADEIINRYEVEYAFRDEKRYAVMDNENNTASAYPTGVNRLKVQLVTGQGFPSISDAESYGQQMANRHGDIKTKGATLKIPSGCPIYDDITGHVIPPWRVQPNERVRIPDLPEPEEFSGMPAVDLRISKKSWDQHDGSLTLTMGNLGDVKRLLRQAVQQEERASQPNDPPDTHAPLIPDKPASSSPLLTQGINPTGGNGPGYSPEDPVVPIKNVPSAVRTVTFSFVVPATEDGATNKLDFGGIIVGVAALGPLNRSGSADIIVGHSTFADYGTITNLASLSVSGTNGKAEDTTVRQQVNRGELLYAAFPSPPTDYQYVTVMVTIERNWEE